MTFATEADYRLIRELRKPEISVLKDMDGDRVPDENGTIIITCADGDRITDLLTFHWGVCSGHHCHHTFSLNGGALLVNQKSPLDSADECRVLLKHIVGANKLKKISTIMPYIHWPCGAAISAEMTLMDAFKYFVRAKDNIRRHLLAHKIQPAIVPCFHVDYPDGKKLSYFFDRKRYDEWLKSRPCVAA